MNLKKSDLKQQIVSNSKLEENNGPIMFFIIEKPEGKNFYFPQNSVSII